MDRVGGRPRRGPAAPPAPHHRPRHRATAPGPAAAKAPDLIGRDLTAGEPSTKYAGGITCLPVDGGKSCCPATVIGLAPRCPAG
ncbi:hypothetical protein [Streptomyces nitrosporeus]|uniref:hypothetical protein n=1 Tax=Streptomyces nitrosporeus TaxID=28894 RepID=UPI003322AEC7